MAPIVLAVVVGHVVTAAVGRRIGRAPGALAGLAGVALVAAWWFFPTRTAWGLPTGTTARVGVQALQEAWALIRVEPTPVQSVPAIVLCMALGAGAAAVCARSLLVLRPPTARRSVAVLAALALLPTAALFGYASLLDSGTDRPQAALAYVVTVAIFAAAVDHVRDAVPGFGARHSALGGRRRVALAPLMLVGGLTMAVAMPLLAAPSLSSMRPRPFVTSADAGIGTAPRLAPLSGIIDSISLVDDVGAVLKERPHQLLFVARSPVATYWQVATLTTYDGGRWLADPETAAAVEGGALSDLQLPRLPEPAATGFYEASVTVEGMDSHLLPVPPAVVSVTGAAGVAQLVPGLGARLPTGSFNGLTYGVRAAAQSRPADRQPSAAEAAPYLQLPPVSPDVVALTRQVVAGARDPLSRVRALDDFFARGGFRYSLSVDDPGPDRLAAFLFQTRAGFCQQYAGAYGVMARLAGLPTRIAVGFTAGALVDGAYRVTGADAHVWPEVYLGRSLGWVSVDPTPAAPGVRTATAPEVVVPSAADAVGADGLSVGRFAPRGGSASAPVSPSSSATRYGGVSAVATARRSSHLWWVPGVLVLFLSAVVVGRRRLVAMVRQVKWRRLPPRNAVLAMWREAAASAGRLAYETPHEHADRVSTAGETDAAAFAALARLAAWAGYSGQDVTSEHRATARRLYAAAARR
jgi:transglutaminase-like putative cysteine protease